jgi:hypothetical protein
MDATKRLLATGLVATLLGGCAVGQRLGWNATPVDATDRVRASCEEATRTLKGGPDHATALRACLEAKTRQGVRS